MARINTGRGRVPRVVQCAFVAAALAVSLVGASAPPASAGTSHPNKVNEAGGVQEHTGHIVVPPTAQCAQYHNFRGISAFDTDAPGQSPQPVVIHGGTGGPDATFNGRFRADIDQPLGDPVTWYEFTTGSFSNSTCTAGPGAVISGFRVTISYQSSDTGDTLSCPAFSATYKRLGVDQTFTGTAACTVDDGDNVPVNPVTRTGTITLVTKIVACEPPIAPPACVTRGGTITFSGYTP